MKKMIMFFAVSCMVLSNAVYADMIIDTGQPPDTLDGPALVNSQWMAGEFTLTQAYTITDVLGWMVEFMGGGDVTVAIYGDGGDVPDGSKLYSYTSDLSPGISDDHCDWVGAQGVSWNLDAGTYWVAFEVPESGPNYTVPSGAPSPLDNYALYWGSSWNNYDSLNIGVRIYGEPVPVPGAMLLGMLGLSAVGIKLRKFA